MAPIEPITLPAPQLQSVTIPRSKWEREYEAFRRLLPGLLQTHRGKYVVIHNEQVVASGTDDLALALEFFAKHGNVAIHVGLVTDEPEPVIRFPHYRKAVSVEGV
jgi:hypothetical protein